MKSARHLTLSAVGALLLAAGAGLPLTPPSAVASVSAQEERLDNPYAGAKPYVNPDWSAKAAAEPGGDAIANEPTFVWMDSIAAIDGTGEAMGLRAHLDEALAQEASLVQVVLYNLPGRDCGRLTSDGELAPEEIDRYHTEYIDAIAEILADPAYADLKIVTVIEPDSLPNMVTYADNQDGATGECQAAKEDSTYKYGVGYALAELGNIRNVYNYLDAGHRGWLGWDNTLDLAVDEFREAATTNGADLNDVHGFIVNTAGYGALNEPHFTIDDTVNDVSVRQSKWVDQNNYLDEQSFALGLRDRLVEEGGFDPAIGMLIDTSRSGWGGAARPTGPGPKTSVDEYVNESRVDRRLHPGNWCNQAGAGLGERPQAAPASGIDAYVWAKAPGESDGSSEEIPNDEGKNFNPMCDPAYEGDARNGDNPTGALPGAPLAGEWFSEQFQELLQNAYPPLS